MVLWMQSANEPRLQILPISRLCRQETIPQETKNRRGRSSVSEGIENWYATSQQHYGASTSKIAYHWRCVNREWIKSQSTDHGVFPLDRLQAFVILQVYFFLLRLGNITIIIYHLTLFTPSALESTKNKDIYWSNVITFLAAEDSIYSRFDQLLIYLPFRTYRFKGHVEEEYCDISNGMLLCLPIIHYHCETHRYVCNTWLQNPFV